VNIGAGTYREQLVIAASGTAGHPITFQAIAGQTVLISPPLMGGDPTKATITMEGLGPTLGNGGGSYITLNGLHIQGWQGNPQAPASDHYASNVVSIDPGIYTTTDSLNDTIINSELYNGLHCGVKEMVGAATNVNLTVQNSYIHNNGTTGIDHGIYGCDHCSFINNTINDNAGWGIHAYSGYVNGVPFNVLVSGSSFSGNGLPPQNQVANGGGAVVLAGANATVVNNTGTGNSEGIMYFRGGCQNPVVTHNDFFGNTYLDADWDNGGGNPDYGSPSGIIDNWNIYKTGLVNSKIPLGANDCVVASSILGPSYCGVAK
jgi:hypothetical protein